MYIGILEIQLVMCKYNIIGENVLSPFGTSILLACGPLV